MTTQINTIELNPELVNMAYEVGLNIQKTCENSLKEAIRRLQGLNFENISVRNAGGHLRILKQILSYVLVNMALKMEN